ncbi:MAG TPA: uracil-DNA glycosylase family protein [Vicinamibacteria bacterium]|nr:uracil-DNA glycosylase family protein [Vicinamibacteria bacterium]
MPYLIGARATVGALKLIEGARRLGRKLDALSFGPPVTHVYNPLSYAWELHRRYLERYGDGEREVVLVGMNPGPWGMVQTGVPFGDVEMVRDWLGIDGRVGRPKKEHPRRRVRGFECHRSEVSGHRLWGWARERFGSPERFFERFFVLNYCPLAFLERSGRNRTPDHLPAKETAPLFELCDETLYRAVGYLRPRWVIGIGRFAERRAQRALTDLEVNVGFLSHPSPANPRSNRGWDRLAEEQLHTLGIEVP